MTEAEGLGAVAAVRTYTLGFRTRMIAAVASGLLAAATLAHLGFSARGVILAGFVSVLPPLAALDIEHRVLPNRIVLPSLSVVLVAHCAFYPGHALEWIGASLGAGAFLLLPALFYRDAVGMGDVKLAALLGAALGRDVTTAFLIASFALLPVALFVLVRHGRAARKMALPFGPFLALGAAVSVLLI